MPLFGLDFWLPKHTTIPLYQYTSKIILAYLSEKVNGFKQVLAKFSFILSFFIFASKNLVLVFAPLLLVFLFIL